jgi:hypothetical protein
MACLLAMTNPVQSVRLSIFGISREELWPGGLWAAGRSSTDPATACKAEKKKRCQGARIVTERDAPACNLLRNHDARVLHASVYSRSAENWQVPACLFAICTISALLDGRKSLGDPELDQRLPRDAETLRLGIDLAQHANGQIEIDACQFLVGAMSTRPVEILADVFTIIEFLVELFS